MLRDRSKTLPDLGGREESTISWRFAAVGISICFVVGLVIVLGFLRL